MTNGVNMKHHGLTGEKRRSSIIFQIRVVFTQIQTKYELRWLK